MDGTNISLAALFKGKAAGQDISSAFWMVQDIDAGRERSRQHVVGGNHQPPYQDGFAAARGVAPVTASRGALGRRPGGAAGYVDDPGNGVQASQQAGGGETLQGKDSADAGPRRGMVASDRIARTSLSLAAGDGASEARRARGKKSLRGNEVAPPILTGGSTQAPLPSSRIDWISFTVQNTEQNLKRILGTIEKHLLRSFIGSRISLRPLEKKLNGYTEGWCAYAGKQVVGFVAWGGDTTGDTIFVNAPGELCSRLDYVQFKVIYRLGKRLGVKITRVDHAVDFYRGEIPSVKWIERQWKKRPRDFWATKGGQLPRPEDFHGPKGDSFYLGGREARTRMRIYEKGRYAGDKNSQWVRAELQMRQDKHSPLSIECLNPDTTFDHLAGRGPFWADLLGRVGTRRSTLRKAEWESLRAQVLGVVRHVREQYGGMHKYLSQVLGHQLAGELVADQSREWGAVKHKPYATDAGFMEMLAADLLGEFLRVPVTIVERGVADDPLSF